MTGHFPTSPNFCFCTTWEKYKQNIHWNEQNVNKLNDMREPLCCCMVYIVNMRRIVLSGVVYVPRSDHWVPRVPLCQLWLWRRSTEAEGMWNGAPADYCFWLSFNLLKCNIHSYYTRRSNALHLPAVRTILRKRSIIFTWPLICNRLNPYFLILPSVVFLFNYKKFLISIGLLCFCTVTFTFDWLIISAVKLFRWKRGP